MPEYDKFEFDKLMLDGFFKECTDDRFTAYFGDADDLVARYYNAARINDLDIIVRVTADCPFGGVLIDDMLTEYIQNKYNGYMSSTEAISKTPYQDGVDVEIFSMELMAKAKSMASTKYQREHVTPYFYDGSSSCNKHPYDNCAPHTVIPNKFYNFSFDNDEDRKLIIELCKNYDACDNSMTNINKLIYAIENTSFPSREYKKIR